MESRPRKRLKSAGVKDHRLAARVHLIVAENVDRECMSSNTNQRERALDNHGNTYKRQTKKKETDHHLIFRVSSSEVLAGFKCTVFFLALTRGTNWQSDLGSASEVLVPAWSSPVLRNYTLSETRVAFHWDSVYAAVNTSPSITHPNGKCPETKDEASLFAPKRSGHTLVCPPFGSLHTVWSAWDRPGSCGSAIDRRFGIG